MASGVAAWGGVITSSRVSVAKSAEKGRMGWGRAGSGLLNSCSSISSSEPEAWRTLQRNALGSHGRTGGQGIRPAVLELSNLSAGKSSGLGSVTVKAVCGLSCPFCHLPIAAPVSQLRRARLSGREGGVSPSMSPSHTAHPDLTLSPSPGVEFWRRGSMDWTPGLCSMSLYTVFTGSHPYGGDLPESFAGQHCVTLTPTPTATVLCLVPASENSRS